MTTSVGAPVSPSVTATLPAAGDSRAGACPAVAPSVIRTRSVVRCDDTRTPSTRARALVGRVRLERDRALGQLAKNEAPFRVGDRHTLRVGADDEPRRHVVLRDASACDGVAPGVDDFTLDDSLGDELDARDGVRPAAAAVGDRDSTPTRAQIRRRARADARRRAPARAARRRRSSRCARGARRGRCRASLRRPRSRRDRARRRLRRWRSPRATRRTVSASPLPSVVAMRGACPGLGLRRAKGSPRPRLIAASPRSSVNAVVRRGESAASELALTWAVSTGRSRSSTTETTSTPRGSGRRIVTSLRPPSGTSSVMRTSGWSSPSSRPAERLTASGSEANANEPSVAVRVVRSSEPRSAETTIRAPSTGQSRASRSRPWTEPPPCITTSMLASSPGASVTSSLCASTN